MQDAPTPTGGRFRVAPAAAVAPLVLALDVGSTATRGGLYDAAGRPVAGWGRKVPHAFRTAADGTSEIDADQVTAELAEVLDGLATDPPASVGGVALDTFASSLVGVGADGRAVGPCHTYADSRCAAQVDALRRELDEDAVQQRTGCRLHSSYLPARLRWLRETQPDRFGAARTWVSIGEYAVLRLTGSTAAGTSTAAWSGLLDRRTGRWDSELLAAAGIRAEQLSEVRDPDRPLPATSAVGARWPALAGAVWFAPVTDGFASNLGAGADDAHTAALSAATSGAIRVLVHDIPDQVPPGLWCYRVDARRSLLGGAVNDVGRMVSWLDDTVRLGDDDPDRALAAAPDADGPVVLPYLTGERSTGWAASARAAVVGATASTTGAQLYRAGMEGVAVTYRRVLDALRTTAADPRRILASGRVTQDLPSFLQVLADVLDTPVWPVTVRRTTLHGTALQALDVLVPGVPRAAVPTGSPVEPRAEHRSLRRTQAAEFDRLYAALVAPAGR